MWKKGDRVMLKWDDSRDNQAIIGKTLVVIEPPRNPLAPCWMDVVLEADLLMTSADTELVEDEFGRPSLASYTVRGTDCRAP